jgi:hypothetical protein
MKIKTSRMQRETNYRDVTPRHRPNLGQRERIMPFLPHLRGANRAAQTYLSNGRRRDHRSSPLITIGFAVKKSREGSCGLVQPERGLSPGCGLTDARKAPHLLVLFNVPSGIGFHSAPSEIACITVAAAMGGRFETSPGTNRYRSHCRDTRSLRPSPTIDRNLGRSQHRLATPNCLARPMSRNLRSTGRVVRSIFDNRSST